MTKGRVIDEGRDVLTIRVTAVAFTCGNGHEWILTTVEIRAAIDTAETCPECGSSAETATIADQQRRVERRGVVVTIRQD